MRRKIVVATTDALTEKMAGPAIRAWHIADALSREHDVELVTTAPSTLQHPRFPVRTVWKPELRSLERWCDVFLFQGFLLDGYRFLRRSGKVMVVDVYDPFHLEQLEQSQGLDPDARREVVNATVAILNEQLLRGDFLMCASDKQRDFWLGQLAALGRINPVTYDADPSLASLMAVVPFGLPDEPPRKTGGALKGVLPGIGPDDKVILWGGGIYNWFDPLTLIRAVDKLRIRRGDVRLVFMGLKHPNPAVPEMRMAVAAQGLADELGLIGSHVFFNEGWVPYDERQNFLLDADVGVSTHFDHVETAFSFRTRMLDYIWASLPIVATAGDSLADLVERNGLGLTVPAEDVDALEAALATVLDDGNFAEGCRNALASTAPQFRWSTVLQPLVQFCRDAHRAPDLIHSELQPRLRRTTRAVVRERRGVRHNLDDLRRHIRHGRVDVIMRAVGERAVGPVLGQFGRVRRRLFRR